MGANIIQDNKPVAFLSCKLNDFQLIQMVGDKELVYVIMILELCIMLYALRWQAAHSYWPSQHYHKQHYFWWCHLLAQLCWIVQPLYSFCPWQKQCHCWHAFSVWATGWIHPLSKRDQFFVLKDSISKVVDFVMTFFLWVAFYISLL